MVNGIIKGINWVLDKVGSKKRLNSWSPDFDKFAKGSNGLSHNTMGIVNDQKGSTYKELIVPPKGKPFIPEGRNVMLPLQKGTKIMPANQTKKLVEATGGVPKFAGGIGDFFGDAWSAIKSFSGNVLDYLTHPGDIVKIAIDKFTDMSDMVEPWLSVAKGAVDQVLGGITDFIKDIFDKVGGQELRELFDGRLILPTIILMVTISVIDGEIQTMTVRHWLFLLSNRQVFR